MQTCETSKGETKEKSNHYNYFFCKKKYIHDMLIAEVMGEEERVTNILASTKRHISVSEIKVTMSIFRTVSESFSKFSRGILNVNKGY